MTQVTSPVQLYKMLKDWHDVAVHNAENILNVPTDGSIKVTVTSKEDTTSVTEVVLDEDSKHAFFAGAQAVLCLFEDLPFEFDEPVSSTTDETA